MLIFQNQELNWISTAVKKQPLKKSSNMKKKTIKMEVSLMSQLFLQDSNTIKWRVKGVSCFSWEKEPINLMCLLASEEILMPHTALSLVKKSTSAIKSQFVSQYELCMITGDSFVSICNGNFRRNIWTDTSK